MSSTNSNSKPTMSVSPKRDSRELRARLRAERGQQDQGWPAAQCSTARHEEGLSASCCMSATPCSACMTSCQHALAQQAQEPAAAWLLLQEGRVRQQTPLAVCAPAHSQVCCYSLRSLSTMSTGAMMSPGCPTHGTAADRSGTSSTSPTGARPDDSTTCAGRKHSSRSAP